MGEAAVGSKESVTVEKDLGESDSRLNIYGYRKRKAER